MIDDDMGTAMNDVTAVIRQIEATLSAVLEVHPAEAIKDILVTPEAFDLLDGILMKDGEALLYARGESVFRVAAFKITDVGVRMA